MAHKESGLLSTALGLAGRSPFVMIHPDSKARALFTTEAILKLGDGKIDMFRIVTTDYTDLDDIDIFVVNPPPDVRELDYRSPPLLVITPLCLRDRERSAQEYWNFLRLKPWHQTEFGATRFGVTEKTPQPYTGAEQSREQAIQWLSRCQANADGSHAQCNQEIRDWLPSRLLDVQGTHDTASLKLVIPAENPNVFASDKRYITLSHCWGRWGAVNLPVLNTKNLHERTTNGLDLSLLPQTFKDALVIAQWFQVRWLWIDSLCIVQDSVTDWEKESLMMHSVYKNALLNISADDAADARSGCFRHRHQLSVYPLQVGLAGCPDIDWFWLTYDSKSLFERALGAETARRAWIFQERQLSRRVLHFTSTEMIWECCARQAESKQPYFACETFPDGAPLESVFTNRPKFQSQSDLVNASLAELHTTWDMLCKSYSEKSLTKVTDKAVALSGLAQEFQARLPNDSYVAGLWRSTLPQSLLWVSTDESARINVDDFIAPSWSWLSIDGPIRKFESYHSTYALAVITNVSIGPVISSEPTGSIRSASIEMQCYLRAVTVRPDYEAKPWFTMSVGGTQCHNLSIEGLEQELKIGAEMDFSFDTSYSETCGPASVSGFFVPICISPLSESARTWIHGLLVEPVDNDHTVFRRIGTLTISGSHCMYVKYMPKEPGSSWERLGALLNSSDLNSKEGRHSKNRNSEQTQSSSSSQEAYEAAAVYSGSLSECKNYLGSRKTPQMKGYPVNGIVTTRHTPWRGWINYHREALETGREIKDIVEAEFSEEKDDDRDVPAEKAEESRDLGPIDALDRLYAEDGAFEGSPLESDFERLTPRLIKLI
ncbi:hypothetical protein G7054_g2205 [Neopestalotiopsis clavispora]|nr:hypothetical protein G7054_g2205 [Neopestalotiopsis clavispora]